MSSTTGFDASATVVAGKYVEHVEDGQHVEHGEDSATVTPKGACCVAVAFNYLTDTKALDRATTEAGFNRATLKASCGRNFCQGLAKVAKAVGSLILSVLRLSTGVSLYKGNVGADMKNMFTQSMKIVKGTVQALPLVGLGLAKVGEMAYDAAAAKIGQCFTPAEAELDSY